jgi:hypothetical protein
MEPRNSELNLEQRNMELTQPLNMELRNTQLNTLEPPTQEPERPNEPNPEKSWFSGITDTISQFSASPKDVSNNVTPEMNTFGIPKDNVLPNEGPKDNTVLPNEGPKDIFGFSINPTPAAPVAETVAPAAETAAPVVESVVPAAPVVESVEKDMFGFPKTQVPAPNQINANKKETNIVLKPLTLQPIKNPINMNTYRPYVNAVPSAPVPADVNAVNAVPSAPVNVVPAPMPAVNKPVNVNKNKPEDKRPRNMFGEILD